MAAIPDRERRWYFSREVLLNSPSRRCQIEPEKELSYRQQAANLIQDMGQRLQVNQLCINTAIVYMHRFYVFHSFQKFPRNSIAAAALFLAAKVEEQPHKLEYVIKVHHACLHRGAPFLDTNSDAYLQQAQELVINESILLQTLGFEVAVDHPHTHVVKCTQMIRGRFKNAFGTPSKDLAQTSYFMATNSLHLTTFCLQYKPTVVACVCIYLVAKWSQWEIMKSSDGKDWWEYVDPTVTKELLDELTNEFLRIFEACPSRLRRRISNERITSRRPRPKEGTTESQSSSSTKLGPSTSASMSSVDNGLPGSSNSESSINTQESASSGQGESLSDLSHTDGEKLGLHEINMGLPMMEASLFSLDTEYMSGYNSSVESKQGLPSSQSDPERGRAGDQQGHPVKKSLKEYREQKERERLKAAQQSSRNSVPPRPSQTASRPGTQANPHPHSLKGNVNSPHTDQRHREGYHSQVSQKYRPEDRHLPSDHRRAEKPSGPRLEQLGNHPSAKSSGRQTDIRPGRDQRPHSQHRPHDPAGHPTHGASATDSKYSKSSDQYHKHNRDAVQNSLDRKQSFGPNVQGKEYRKNGLESRDQGANSRPPETLSRLPSVTAPSKLHTPGSQRLHHTESTKTHSSDKVLTSDPHGKAHPETLRPTKSETHRSQRPENQETLKPEKHRTPTAELLRVQKAQSLKPQRSETPKVPPTEKQPTRPAVPPLVPLVNATKEQRQVGLPAVSTQKAEPPQPIDHELPEPQRPERVLVQQLETVKVDKTVPPLLSRHDVSKVQKSEDMGLRRPEVLKVSKSDTSRTGLPHTQSPTVSKPKGPEVPKMHKSEVSRSQKAEMPRLPRTGTDNAHKVEAQKHQKSDTSRGEDSGIPQTQKPTVSRQLKPVKVELQLPETQVPRATGVEEPCAVKTHKAAPSQPSRQETSKKHRTKPELGQTQRPVTPKSQTLPATGPIKLEKSPLGKQHALLSPKVVDPSSQKRELPVVQNEPRIKVETPDMTASVKPAVRKKPQTPPASKSEAPTSDKLNTPSSEKLVIAKPKQPDIPSSDIPEKIKPQKPETVTPHKTNTQPKPSTPKSQRSMTPKSQQSPGASHVSKPSKVTSVEVSKVTNADAGGNSEKKVIWESVKPLEVLKPGGPNQAADNESVDADIEKLITAHMAEVSEKPSLDPLQFLDIKPTLPQSNTTEVRQRKRERDESSLPKSYRDKESHHRKKRSEDHRSRGSPHKHRRLPDHKKEPSLDADGPQGAAEHRGNAAEAAEDSHPHTSILTTTSGIKLKIKGLSNSMNSGSTGGNLKQEASPEPSQQTGSPALRLKLNLSKMQASQPNSDHHPQSEGERSERSSSHHPGHHRHHHRKHHKHHHKSRSQHRSGGSGESHRRKRSHSRSDSMSSGGRDGSPAITSPPKKRAHGREGHSQPKSLLPGDQSLLSLPMPPMDPAEARDSGYMHYNNSPSAASTGQFYNMSEFSYHAPLTTVTALPSSDVYGFYPDNRSSEDLPPPPPPPRQEQSPPPPPPPV